MAKEELTLQAFTGGEQSERMYGRDDLPIFRTGCRRLENFLLQTQGSAEFRQGFAFANHTRLNQKANLIKFEFNDVQAYMLEFTEKKLRFYRNNGFILETAQTITNITQADPAVVTITAHGLADDDEIFITGVVGMTEVNGKTFLAANVAANTFELTDIDSANVDSTGFDAYSSAGTGARIFEIDTPYTERADLFQLDVSQNADTLYIVHPFFDVRKLTRTDHTAWTLVRQVRTGTDHFLTEKAITNITQANPGVVTSTAHGYSNEDIFIIEEVLGMTEVNSRVFIAANVTANTVELTDLDGNNIDTSGFAGYASAGFMSLANLLPSTNEFYESRLFFAGFDATPARLIGSDAPDSSGVPQFDVYTNGTGAANAIEFEIAEGEVNKILWLAGTDRLLLAGTFGSEVKLTGSTANLAITPTSIQARPLGRVGVDDISPINKLNSIIYMERGGLRINTYELDPISETFVPEDLTLVANHITLSRIKQMTWQTGAPDIAWFVRNDGVLIGLTFERTEKIAGYHRHTTGALKEDKFLSIATMPRPTSFEQIWVVVERKIGANTRRNVEFQVDPPEIPEIQDFFTGSANETADRAKFDLAMAEAQKGYKHLDSHLTYDGSLLGSDAGATMTPAAITGDSVVFTASAAVFLASHATDKRQIWKKAIDGVGEGRAEITTFTNSTTVTCKILKDFDNTDAMAIGNWYLTTDEFVGLNHLVGRLVRVVADGTLHPDRTVADAVISFTLDFQASVVHAGLGYEGFLQPMSLEMGGTTGPAQTKTKNVREVRARFLKSLGAETGDNIYKPETILFTQMPLQVGQPTPLFTGIKKTPFRGNWEESKVIYIRQPNPLPCIVQLLQLYGETDND